MMSASIRELTHVTNGHPAMDGAGVRMTRIIGTPELNMLDPFLLFDVFESDKPDDYIGGFPAHPHRGFETVTYLLAGRMRHKDSNGNEGVIEPGGVQWMTAGRGIIHSEMPEQEDGLLQGFQLWVNLPAKYKMTDAAYQEFSPGDVSIEQYDNGTTIRVIAGKTNKGTVGPVKNAYVNPTYLDVKLTAGGEFEQTVSQDDNTFLFVISGSLTIGTQQRRLSSRQLGRVTQGELVSVKASENSQFLFVSAQPLKEAVARGGPFVMNTKQEIRQAFNDYETKQLTGV